MFLESFFRAIFSSDIFGSNSIFKSFLVVCFGRVFFGRFVHQIFLVGFLLKIVL